MQTELRFREVFDQAPVSMQLLAADGTTIQVNKAWEALWQGTYGDGLKEHVLHGGFNVLTDAQLQAKGVTPYLLRAYAGESVQIPAILYDPAELGILARARWVTGRAHPIRDADGRIAEVMLMHEDITDRIEADETLRRSEERFRSLVTASSQMVWAADGNGQIVEDSPTWRHFTGQTYDEWKGMGWLNAVHPDDRAKASGAWRASIDEAGSYQAEYRLRRADGGYRWTEARAVPLRRQDGSIREWIGTNTDVTEQRRAEEALRTNEQRLRFILDSMQQKVYTAGHGGDVQYLNPAWTLFTGLPADEIRNGGWIHFVHPDDVDEALRAWQHAVATGTAYQGEHRVLRHDGQYRWHLSQAVPMHDEAGRVVTWIGSNTDIHEVKIVESELARRLETERRHAAILTKVAAASHQLHTVTSIDQMVNELVGMVRDILEVHQAVISLNTDENWSQAINAVSLSDKYAGFRSYVAVPDGSGIYAKVCRTNRSIRLTQDELEAHPDWKGFGAHAPGHPAMRGWLAVPLIGHDGRNIGVLQASDKYQGDFTGEDEAILTQLAAIAATGFENARLYASLQEQHQRKDEFLAMLAHELRNPLAPIRAAADLLALPNLGEERIRQTSGVIRRQVQHMSSLVDDLLDVSRVTRGLIELAGEQLDMKQVVGDAVEQIRPLVEAKRHQLTVTMSAEPAHTVGDHKRLVQILSNILNNAVRYTPQGGRIQVSTQTTAHEVVVCVEDNGVGMPRELQPQVFDLFAQGARSSDRSQGGLGIGLALVRSLVLLHGGQVSCHSEGVGLGSRFVVSLPRLIRQAPDADVFVDKAGQLSDGKALRVLVVDDNVDAAQMLAMYLGAAGYEVLVEHGALAALARARRDRPAVCILDIGLPDMDGNALARQLRADPGTRGALLIAVTGYGSERDKETAAAAGFDHHLVKPVDAGRLAALLAESVVS